MDYTLCIVTFGWSVAFVCLFVRCIDCTFMHAVHVTRFSGDLYQTSHTATACKLEQQLEGTDCTTSILKF